MELNKDGQLFFGCKVDSKMREALALAKPGDRKYFEGDGSEFLQICTAGEARWIGKTLKGGIHTGEVEDIVRNLISILRRISPEIRIATNAVKLFPVAAEQISELPIAAESPAGSNDGPYIDY